MQLINEQLKTKPEDVDLRSTLALYLVKSGDKSSAIAELAKLNLKSITSGGVLYKVAVGYEICGMRDNALSALEAAIRAGYSEQEIKNEPELLSLREDKRYHLMVINPQKR